MPATRKTRPRGKRITKPGARWLRAAQEAGTAAALAALPILIKSLSEALPRQALQPAPKRAGPPPREKPDGRKRKPGSP